MEMREQGRNKLKYTLIEQVRVSTVVILLTNRLLHLFFTTWICLNSQDFIQQRSSTFLPQHTADTNKRSTFSSVTMTETFTMSTVKAKTFPDTKAIVLSTTRTKDPSHGSPTCAHLSCLICFFLVGFKDGNLIPKHSRLSTH